MTEDRDFSAGTFSYRIRMMHYPKGGKQSECLLTRLNPKDLRKKEPKSKGAKADGGEE